jgi:hypothetical protein
LVNLENHVWESSTPQILKAHFPPPRSPLCNSRPNSAHLNSLHLHAGPICQVVFNLLHTNRQQQGARSRRAVSGCEPSGTCATPRVPAWWPSWEDFVDPPKRGWRTSPPTPPPPARPRAAERGAGALGDLCAGKAALFSCDASTRTAPGEAAPS